MRQVYLFMSTIGIAFTGLMLSVYLVLSSFFV